MAQDWCHDVQYYIASMDTKYGWGSHINMIHLFLGSCARIIAREILPSVARDILSKVCELRGARMTREDVNGMYDLILRGNDDDFARVSMQWCVRIPHKLCNLIARLFARCAPLRCGRKKTIVAEYIPCANKALPLRITECDDDVRAGLDIKDKMILTVRDIARADILIYNAIGMREITRILIDEIMRMISRNNGMIALIAHDDDDIYFSRAHWSSRSDGGKKISIFCVSERKMSAIIDIIQW